jgi:hypothetical protein
MARQMFQPSSIAFLELIRKASGTADVHGGQQSWDGPLLRQRAQISTAAQM